MSKLEKLAYARTISEAIEEKAQILANLVLHGTKESQRHQVAYDIINLIETRRAVLNGK